MEQRNICYYSRNCITDRNTMWEKWRVTESYRWRYVLIVVTQCTVTGDGTY